jgi:hypothetical protein
MKEAPMNRSRASTGARTSEWFVPSFGSRRFRSLVGLLFLPYTGMVLSYLVIGSALAPRMYWDRLAAICVIYFLALGIAAHAVDAIGSHGVRPWGEVLGRKALWTLAVSCLFVAYAIAAYFMIRYVPLLWPIALAEGFFVFAYNLEWFGGRFHSDAWFAFSWGSLPVFAGYTMQTNRFSLPCFAAAVATAFFSIVEIKASRPYKSLRRRSGALTPDERLLAARYEAILKAVSLGVITLALGLIASRIPV